MYVLRTIRENARLLLVVGLAYALAASCKKEDAPPAHTVAQMQVVPLADTLPAVITQPTLLTSAHPWFVKGWLYVSNEASLTLEAGARVYALPQHAQDAAGIIVTRGSRIAAKGTEQFPVQLFAGGEGGGVILLGNAPVARHDLYDKNNWLSGAKLSYGGTQPADSSGTLEYVQIIYKENKDHEDIFPGGLLLLGTGSKTVIKNVMLEQGHESPAIAPRKLK